MTPLHWATKKGHQETVSALLTAGANVNVRDFVQRTPLHLAAENGHHETVSALLAAHCADVNVRDYEQRTPLHLAAENGHHETVSVLLAAGADVNVQDRRQGFTPLQYALTGIIHYKCVEVLLQHGADNDGRRDPEGLPIQEKWFDPVLADFYNKTGISPDSSEDLLQLVGKAVIQTGKTREQVLNFIANYRRIVGDDKLRPSAAAGGYDSGFESKPSSFQFGLSDSILYQLGETDERLLMRVWSAHKGNRETSIKVAYSGEVGMLEKDMIAAGISFPAIVRDIPGVPEELKYPRTTEAAVGPAGGELEIPGFVKLIVPPGVLQQDTTVTISTIDVAAILRDPESVNWISGYPWSLGEDACPRELLEQVLFSPAVDVNLHGAQLNGPVEVQTWRPPGSEGMGCLLLKHHDEEGWTNITASTRHHINSDRLSMLLQNFSITTILWAPVGMVTVAGKALLAAFSSRTVDCLFAAYSNPGVDDMEFHIVCRDRRMETGEYLPGFKLCGSNDATFPLYNDDKIKADVSLCGCQQSEEVNLRATLCKQGGQKIQMVLRRPNKYPAIGKVNVLKFQQPHWQSVCKLTFREEDNTLTGTGHRQRDEAGSSVVERNSGATTVAWCIPVVVELKPPWRELGRNLGLSESDTERISQRHRDDTERCCLAVLEEWLHLSGTNATVEGLKTALDSAGQREIVEKLNTIEQTMREQLLELQSEVTDIVRPNFPNLNFVPDKNKEVDERRIEVNRRTLCEEVFSYSFSFGLDSAVLDLIQERKKSVCRINWPGGSGTGFLLSKGKVLTCYHVYRWMYRSIWSVHEASRYTATFFVSTEREYKVPFESPAALLKCYSEDLDYAILQLAVEDEMERNLESLPLLAHFISESENSRKMVVLVGHPAGGSKIVDFARIAGAVRRYIVHVRYMIQEDERKPLYDTSVMFHGSSGSPGFDTYGNVVLMHTRGFPDASSNSRIERGVCLPAIRDHARQNLAPEVFNEIFPATSEQVTVSLASLSMS
ncbi:uncharacterized protein LOC144866015 isoform X2 [Branchiostoma floridae x Branchiostoma japonicum]